MATSNKTLPYSCCGKQKNEKDGWRSHCHPCRAKHARKARLRPGAREARQQYLISVGKVTGEGFWRTILATLKELTQEEQAKKAESDKLWSRFNSAQAKGVEKWRKAFWGKIFQSITCADCGTVFDTLYAKSDYNPNGTERCKTCRDQRRLKNHGGGPRRRCKWFDVPYTVLSPGKIYHEEGWICHLCNKPVDSALLGQQTPGSPTLEHLWPLSVIIDGYKSPGHIRANIRLAHMKCNSDKGDRVSEEEAKMLVARFYPGNEVSSGFVHAVVFDRTCRFCKQTFQTTKEQKMRCSEECAAKEDSKKHNKRRRDKNRQKWGGAYVNPTWNWVLVARDCSTCLAVYHPNLPYQKYCKESCSKKAMRLRKRLDKK